MKELTLRGSFYDMGQQYGQECKKEIRSFAKMSHVMASLSKKPGSQPFNPNMWRLVPTLLTYKKEKSKWQGLAKQYEQEILKYHPDAVEVMHAIASDHGDAEDGTLNKSICQHLKGLKYNYKTLVSFIAQPKEKCFWIYEGCPCDNKVRKYDFQD